MRRNTSIAIHAILAGLILIPLHYYTINRDKRDERFAWRMFSPIRSESCAAQFFIDNTRFKASSVFHNAWVGIAQRGRTNVIKAMAQRLCDDNPGKSVRIRIQCEQFPASTLKNRRQLYDLSRRDSDDNVELVASGAFNFCDIGAL